MTRYLMVVSAVALLAGCNKPHNATGANSATEAVPPAAATAENVPPSNMPEANPAATVPTPANEAAAPDFVQKAAVSDMFEIQSSSVALKRSSDPDVKAFAQMMIKDHTASTAALKAAIKASGQALPLPTSLPQDKTSALNDLTNMPAANFDMKFMEDQADGHQAALDLMARYADDGKVDALKTFATKTGTVVQQHLDRAKAIRGTLK